MTKSKLLPTEQLNRLRPVNIRSLNIGDYVIATPTFAPFKGEVVRIDGLSDRVAVRCAHGQIRKFNVLSIFKPTPQCLFVPNERAWMLVDGVPTEVVIEEMNISPDTKEYRVSLAKSRCVFFTRNHSELFATREDAEDTLF